MRQQRWPAMIALSTMVLVSCTLAPSKPTAIEPDDLSQSLPEVVDETAEQAVDAKNSSAPEPSVGDDRDLNQADGGSVEASSVEIASGERVLPVDEASEDESFVAFRAQLIEAVNNKDADFLLGIVSPDIHTGFGRGGGFEDFQQRWQLEDPDSQLWSQLGAVLALGGEFQSDFAEADDARPTFIAPYVFNSFPSRDFSPFEYSAVVAEDVVLRAEPDAESDAIALLSHHIVKIDRADSIEAEPGSYQYSWYKVATTDGEAGYVDGQYVRSPIDYRAFFEKEAGQWMMTTFLAGD